MVSTSTNIFVLVNDPQYFDTIKAVEGGEIKIEARGPEEIIDTCSKGDIVIVWLSDDNVPAAYFSIVEVSNRPDLIGLVEEFDEKNEKPHQVRLENNSVIRMDLRRDTYKILTLKNRALLPKTLSSPLVKPMRVKIRWTVYKHTVSGNKLHLLDDLDAADFGNYSPPASGFELLEGEDRQKFIKALDLDVRSTKSPVKSPSKSPSKSPRKSPTKSPTKRKLDYIASEEEDDEQTLKKRKTTPKNSPTPGTRSSPRTTPSPSNKKSSTSPSPSSTKSSPSNKKSTPPTSPLYSSPRVSKQTNHYSPPPHVVKSRTPSPVKKSDKPKKSVKFDVGTKPPSAINPNPGRRTSKRTADTVASSDPAEGLPVTLQEGIVLAIRADEGKDFVVAKVRQTTTVKPGAQRDVVRTPIPVTWLVEAHEPGLRGCYAAPKWHATVEWGAVVKLGLKMKYDKEKDMYWLSDKAKDLVALV